MKMKTETPKGRQIREQILRLTEEYYHTEHVKASYKDGDTINYGGRIYDEKELLNLVNSSLDFWLTTGPWTEKFEADFCNFLGVKNCSVVNSGSSANLLAFMALRPSHKLCKPPERCKIESIDQEVLLCRKEIVIRNVKQSGKR